jgi:hypothetical protein
MDIKGITPKNYRKILNRKILYIIKRLNYPDDSEVPKKILFIVGCQRSGTTLLTDIFDEDYQTKIFPEFSELSNKDKNKIRLNPLIDVKQVINKQKVNLIVIKPLVETQNILHLLKYFPNSYAIFIFRNYKDVANSDLSHFGLLNGIKNLKYIIEEQSNDWRSEYVSNESKRIISDYYSENMPPYDAAVLFWYVRNILFYELNLNRNRRIFLCNYTDLVFYPEIVMKNIYKFIGCGFPSNNLIKHIFTSSEGKGKDIKISQNVDRLCQDLYKRLIDDNKKNPYYEYEKN